MTHDLGAATARLAAAKLWLTSSKRGVVLGDAPYLSTAVYALTTVWSDAVETAAADDRWRLYLRPQWVETADVPVVAGELAHLTWHLLHDHAGRAAGVLAGRSQAAVWRQAADATVAETLTAAGHERGQLQEPSELGLPPGRSAEEYFAMLGRLDALTADEPGETEHGCGSAADGVRRPYEAHDMPGVDPTRAAQVRQAVAIEFREHMTGRGTEPGEWARWVEQVLDPVVPWREVLPAAVRRALGWASGHRDYSYARPSRRRVEGVVLPATRQPQPAVAVVIDTSGSVDDGLLAQALGEVDGVLRALGPAGSRLTVLSCDAAVHTVERAVRARDLRLAGGGGTELQPGIAAAAALLPRPEVVVVLTDGDTPWPSAPPPGCTVVAALLGRSRTHLPATPEWVQRVECVGG